MQLKVLSLQKYMVPLYGSQFSGSLLILYRSSGAVVDLEPPSFRVGCVGHILRCGPSLAHTLAPCLTVLLRCSQFISEHLFKLAIDTHVNLGGVQVHVEAGVLLCLIGILASSTGVTWTYHKLVPLSWSCNASSVSRADSLSLPCGHRSGIGNLIPIGLEQCPVAYQLGPQGSQL
jgi:hypothetical protein